MPMIQQRSRLNEVKVCDISLLNRYYSATLGHGWYFGKESKKIGQKMWSINTSYTLSFRNNTHREGYNSFASLFFARDFALTKRLLIQPELGASILVFDRTYIKDDLDGGYNIPVVPEIAVNLIYRL